MVNLVQSLKVGDTSYTIKDSNTLPGLTADQKSVLLASGTYLDKAVVDGKVFETDAGKFERFNKTVVGSSLQWTSLQTNPFAVGSGIAYGKSVYVLAQVIIVYSKDGTNWTETNAPNTGSYSWKNYVAFGNGVFVRVTQNRGAVDYSEDGINWETFNLPNARQWTSVSFVNDRFMATAESSNYMAYSFNGKDWLETPRISTATSLQDVTYGNGRYVAVGTGYGAYSTDGINWNYSQINAQNFLCSSVAYGNGIFVATREGSYNREIYTSTDGVKWTVYGSALPYSAYWYSVIFTGECFVAIGGSSSNAPGAYSYDGINWVAAPMPSNGDWYDVANADGKAVSVKVNGEVALGSIETQYSYSTTPLSYTAAEVDSKVAEAEAKVSEVDTKVTELDAKVDQVTITEDNVDASTGTLVL